MWRFCWFVNQTGTCSLTEFSACAWSQWFQILISIMKKQKKQLAKVHPKENEFGSWKPTSHSSTTNPPLKRQETQGAIEKVAAGKAELDSGSAALRRGQGGSKPFETMQVVSVAQTSVITSFSTKHVESLSWSPAMANKRESLLHQNVQGPQESNLGFHSMKSSKNDVPMVLHRFSKKQKNRPGRGFEPVLQKDKGFQFMPAPTVLSWPVEVPFAVAS